MNCRIATFEPELFSLDLKTADELLRTTALLELLITVERHIVHVIQHGLCQLQTPQLTVHQTLNSIGTDTLPNVADVFQLRHDVSQTHARTNHGPLVFTDVDLCLLQIIYLLAVTITLCVKTVTLVSISFPTDVTINSLDLVFKLSNLCITLILFCSQRLKPLGYKVGVCNPLSFLLVDLVLCSQGVNRLRQLDEVVFLLDGHPFLSFFIVGNTAFNDELSSKSVSMYSLGLTCLEQQTHDLWMLIEISNQITTDVVVERSIA